MGTGWIEILRTVLEKEYTGTQHCLLYVYFLLFLRFIMAFEQ